ncbi:putative Importin-11 [Glarea lozoyensis 74030]|uniref:Putative Importin-11 n=1 Tax=Glarea lozoyensis (strain ATCC 74030 / MF5533) TaxID=1104152 RepID=H0EH16_GLAL7|nr:putative Importin-11 [Glarea lozoyensis 74030]
MLQVIKELSTARLRTSQTSLKSVTPEIVYLLTEIYTQKIDEWMAFLNGNGEDEGGAVDAMENSLYSIKILRRLLIVGYDYPNHSKDVQQMWELSQRQFGQFLDMVSRDPPIIVSPAKELVEKHLIQFSKLHVQMSTLHPAAFALLPSSLDLVRSYWGLVESFEDLVRQMANIIVTKFFIFRQVDLEAWEEDEDEWEIREEGGGDTWEFEWITIKIAEDNRTLVYQIFQHLLNKEDETNDYVVRVTAARQFKAVVEDFSFIAESFLPYAPDFLARMMALIQEVENTETKMAILETIRMIADQAQRYHAMILPLIHRAVEPGSEMQVYLLEDALDLWSTILTQTSAPASQEVLALADCAFPLLEIGSDNLRIVLTIVESYILLAPEAMLGDTVRLRLVSYMTSLLGVKKRELAGLVTSIVEGIIRAAEKLGGAEGVRLVAKDLFEAGIIEKVISGLRNAWEAHQTVGPERKYPKLDDVVETDYFTILARLALADPAIFTSILSMVGNASEVWSWLGTEWFQHFDSMANIDRQKLSCLALTRLLELPAPMNVLALDKLQDYFAMWTSVVSEMSTGRDDAGDNLIWGPSEGNEFEGPEDARKRINSSSDPVHSVHTFDFIKERLGQFVNSCGGEESFQVNFAVNRQNMQQFRLEKYIHI